MSNARPVAIALGSNLGDRAAHLDYALGRLAPVLTGLRSSTRHETAPVGVPGDQPPYLNAVLTGFTELTPVALLECLQQIERDRGRERPYLNAPRTLDLDLILYDALIVEAPGLVVPHPRFREREFVLAPLAEIAPDWVDPLTGLTVAALLARWRQAPREPGR